MGSKVRINVTSIAPVAIVFAEKRESDVSTRQAVAHDARSDDSSQQEGRPESLSYSTPDHSTPSLQASRLE